MNYLPEKMVKKLLKTMLYSNKPIYLDNPLLIEDHIITVMMQNEATKIQLIVQRNLKINTFEKHFYRIPLSLIVDLGLVNFSVKNDTRIIITPERNINKLFESSKKVTAISDNPDSLIQIYDRSYISYQEINLTKSADIYFKGILISETALRQGVLPSPYQYRYANLFLYIQRSTNTIQLA